jgi:hypothetical protein
VKGKVERIIYIAVKKYRFGIAMCRAPFLPRSLFQSSLNFLSKAGRS